MKRTNSVLCLCQGFYNDRQLVSAESGRIDVLPDGDRDDETDRCAEGTASPESGLSATDATAFALWMENTLKDRVTEIRVSKRLTDSPAMITDHQSAALQRMMRFVNQQAKDTPRGMSPESIPKMAMEVNPAHPIILRLQSARKARCVTI